MKKTIIMMITVASFVIAGCHNSASEKHAGQSQAIHDATTAQAQQTDFRNSISNEEVDDAPCLQALMPFCDVVEAESCCDPKLNAYHYKAGDSLYWVNLTQYDTVQCYYTEEEYNEHHNPEDCVEIQNDGRGCVIDDGPVCNLMLDETDCTVFYTRASCDEELLNQNKTLGDTVPGIWFAYEQEMKCFYTEKEREEYLKANKLKCDLELNGEEHICVTKSKARTPDNCFANRDGEYKCKQ